METPTPVRRASQLVWLLVLLAAVVTVLGVIFDDDLIAAWASRQGLSADDQRVPPSFTPVMIVLYFVIVTLVLVLLAFVRGGHNWARHSLAAVVVLIAIGTIGGIRVDPPTAFLVLGVVSLVIDAAVLVNLWHRGTTAFVTAARSAVRNA